MIKLIPKNKYCWLQPLDSSTDKIGSIIVPTIAQHSNSYRIAKVLGIDSDCAEAKGIEVGATVLYDNVGSVEHRIGNRMYTTVRVLNIVSVIVDEAEQT